MNGSTIDDFMELFSVIYYVLLTAVYLLRAHQQTELRYMGYRRKRYLQFCNCW